MMCFCACDQTFPQPKIDLAFLLASHQENLFPVNKSYINYDNGDNKDNNRDDDGSGNNDDNNVKEYSGNDNNDL